MEWQSEFLSLFMSNSVDDFSTALDLKRANIPSKLYRYRSINSMDYLLNEICMGQIYLAHPKTLNDPFDSCSLLKSNQPSYYIKVQAMYRDSLAKHFGEEALSQIFESPNWYNELMSLVAKESTPAEKQEQIINALIHVVMGQFLELNNSFNNMVRDTSRLACFTTKCDNLPMWNHYAQGHSGVCLEYETSRISNIYTKNRLFPIFYTDKLPDFLERSIGKGKSEISIIDYFLIHKLRDWSYECEWRLIYNTGSWYMSPNDIPPEFWEQGKTLQFIKPSRILLGASISENNESSIRDAGKQHDIPVTKMECTEYGLRENRD